MNASHSRHIIIFDTEFWTDEGVMKRNWGGLDDHSPHLIQIGAFKVKVTSGLPVIEEFSILIKPRDEYRKELPITDYFTNLTGISEAMIKTEGHELAEALDKFKSFTGDAPLYSYGKDIIATIVPSCYIQGIPNPFPATQDKDVRQILRSAGMKDSDINANSSGSLAKFFGIELENHWIHDARCDANSILAALRHLEAQGALNLALL